MSYTECIWTNNDIEKTNHWTEDLEYVPIPFHRPSKSTATPIYNEISNLANLTGSRGVWSFSHVSLGGESVYTDYMYALYYAGVLGNATEHLIIKCKSDNTVNEEKYYYEYDEDGYPITIETSNRIKSTLTYTITKE